MCGRVLRGEMKLKIRTEKKKSLPRRVIFIVFGTKSFRCSPKIVFSTVRLFIKHCW